MRSTFTIWLAALLVAASLAPAIAAESKTDDLYDRAKRASVEVLADDHLEGSGWFADAKGCIVTAAHVLGQPGRRVEVLSPAAGRLEAKVVAVDCGHDLALLQAPSRAEGYPALPLAADVPPPPAEVFVLGAPLYRHAVLLPGTVARKDSVFEYQGGRYVELVHVAATVPSGMSGAAWLNRAGEVVGVQSGVMSVGGAPQGVADITVLGAVRELLRTRRTAATPTIDAAVEELWQQDRKCLSRFPPKTEGLIIKILRDDGPAARAGLKQWDLVVAADGRPVRLIDEMLRAIRAKRPGEKLELTVIAPDGTGKRTVAVTLGTLEVGWP